MSMNYTAWAISQDRYKRLDKLVLIEMCHFANDHTQELFPSYGTIAARAGISRRKVIDIIATFKNDGLITVTHTHTSSGDNTSNRYKFTFKVKSVAEPIPVAVSGASISPPSARSSPPPSAHSSPGSASSSPKQDNLTREDISNHVSKHTQQPLSNLDREATPQPAQTKPAPRQATNSSALPETELCVCKEAFEKLWQESPLPKINKTKAEREFIALWEERGSERMKDGVPHIIADLKRRAESVKNYDSPFWRTGLATHIREKRWIDEDMPARFRSRL